MRGTTVEVGKVDWGAVGGAVAGVPARTAGIEPMGSADVVVVVVVVVWGWVSSGWVVVVDGGGCPSNTFLRGEGGLDIGGEG